MDSFIFKDQSENQWRSTRAYLLPYIPSLEMDLNDFFYDETVENMFEVMEKMSNEGDLKPISWVEAWVLYVKDKDECKGKKGWERYLREKGFKLVIRSEEYQLLAQTA